jgi:hypothetical protein
MSKTMNEKKFLLVMMLSQMFALVGCTKNPDQVTTVRSPNPEIFYTVEQYDGNGPVSADVTRVYAHLEYDGKSAKSSVLEGEYLSVERVTWLGPNEVSLCISHGLTTIFRNRVTLRVEGASEMIRTHLQEASKGICPAPVSIVEDEN